MSESSPYEFKSLDTSAPSIEECAHLLQTVFPKSTSSTFQYLNWLYHENPSGHAVGTNAYRDRELAAHYVTIPLEARLFGQRSKGLLSLNTATHPAHQGKGLFTRLARETFSEGAKQGYEFVVGVANANSTFGFTKKLGFQLVAPLEAIVGVGSLNPVPSRSEIFCRVWSEESLKWRLNNPNAQYSIQTSGDAFQVVRRMKILRVGCIEVILSTFPIESEVGSYLRSRSSSEGSKTSFPWPKLWTGLASKKLKKTGVFGRIPMKLRPSPLNLIFLDLSGQDRKLTADDIDFSALDFDAF